jgi:GT2 family glycosyltransferase
LSSARDQDLEGLDVRIAPPGPPAQAFNLAVEEAVGDFVAFLEAGDELEAGILADVTLALVDHPDTDLLYTDSDELQPGGGYRRPCFKPGWSPDELMSHPYVGRLLVVRSDRFRQLAGFRQDFGDAFEYDFLLRLAERSDAIAHLPEIGYHRLGAAQQTSEEGDRRALQAAAQRRDGDAGVEPGLCPGTWRVRRSVATDLVSVIVPFHNGAEHLRRCITSLQERAGHDRWEAILVDNGSWDPETRAQLIRLRQDPRCRVLAYPGPFNWAAINNLAARSSNGTHLLFMNADVEGASAGWMTALLEHSQRPEIGAVGARLLYPDGRVQHAGVVVGLGGGVAWHVFCFCPVDRSGYLDQAKVIRNTSAVTGACMMVRREVFDAVGGFDEELPLAYNDIDFCLRLRQTGYRVVYTPFAELAHDESSTRGRVPPDGGAVATMKKRWGSWIGHDPYFNPNLDLSRPEAVLASPPGCPPGGGRR